MIAREHIGARIIFRKGAAIPAPPVPVPAGWLAARYSLVSSGTELRRLVGTANGGDHPAGYMTVVGPPGGEQRLVPVPHGAAAKPDDQRSLPIPAATRPEHVAVARFQVMAALGLERWTSYCLAHEAVVVVGGGPVAVGCVLELKRLGVAHVLVVTCHPQPAVADLPDVTVVTQSPPGDPTHSVVIDCTGRSAQALEMVAPGGLLGLLGTAADEADLSSAAVHRRGVAVVGMHELAGHSNESRQAMFQTVLQLVTIAIDIDARRGWFATVPGEQAGRFYAALVSAQRPTPPFAILEWS